MEEEQHQNELQVDIQLSPVDDSYFYFKSKFELPQ